MKQYWSNLPFHEIDIQVDHDHELKANYSFWTWWIWVYWLFVILHFFTFCPFVTWYVLHTKEHLLSNCLTYSNIIQRKLNMWSVCCNGVEYLSDISLQSLWHMVFSLCGIYLGRIYVCGIFVASKLHLATVIQIALKYSLLFLSPFAHTTDWLQVEFINTYV